MLIGSSISMVTALISRILVSNHLSTRTALAVSEAAAKELSLSSTVFEESSQGILVTNPQGRILMANNAFTQLTGYRNAIVKAQPGQPVRAAFLTAPGALIEIPFP